MNKWIKASLAAILLSIGTMAAVGYFDGDKAPPTTDPTSALPDLSVDSSEIIAAYERNEIAADTVFRGKVLRVSGRVSRIRRDIGDDAHVEIGGAHHAVDCEFSKGWLAEIAKLRSGDSVVVNGRCTGLLVGSVMLRDCEITE